MTATAVDWAAYMAPAARKLRGEPSYESRDELRFGGRGSLCVTLTGERRGTWYDHEAGEGGGVLDLIRRETGLTNGEAVAWLRAELGAAIPARPRGRPSKAEYVERIARTLRLLAGTPAEAYLTAGRGRGP